MNSIPLLLKSNLTVRILLLSLLLLLLLVMVAAKLRAPGDETPDTQVEEVIKKIQTESK